MAVDLDLAANLALAAYHIDETREIVGFGRNNVKEGANMAYVSAIFDMTFLDSTDLVLPSGTSAFGLNGLGAGIYTNQNAAALVGHRFGTLYIAFRGTNDNEDHTPVWTSPDGQDWFDKTDHYALYADLLSGLDVWAASNGINKVVVTGHSLGAGMVEGLLDDVDDTGLFAGIDVEAVNFASPGYPGTANQGDALTTFNLRSDLVGWPGTLVTRNAGDVNVIEHNITGFEHRMALYAEFIEFFTDNGLTQASFRDLYGVDYDRIYAHVHDLATEDGSWLLTGLISPVGYGRNVIYATGGDEILLGGDGNDLLVAYGGDDYLDGGADKDTMYGGWGDDKMFGRAGVDTMEGGRDDDVLMGGGNTDVLKGQSGKDILAGERGRDYLYGGSGIDHLYGGDENDQLTGGWSTDYFIFKNDGSLDTVRDFGSKDVLVVEDYIDGFTRSYANGVTTVNLYDGASLEYQVKLDGRYFRDFLEDRIDMDGIDAAMAHFADYLVG